MNLLIIVVVLFLLMALIATIVVLAAVALGGRARQFEDDPNDELEKPAGEEFDEQ